MQVIGGTERGGSGVHVVNLTAGLGPAARLICLTDGPVAERARRQGIPVQTLRMSGPWDLSVVFRLRRCLKETGADLVHSHGVRANLVTRLAARGLPVRSVTTVHSSLKSDYRGSWKARIFPLLERRTRIFTHHFVAVAESLAAQLRQDGVPAAQLSVVPNALGAPPPASRLDLRRELGLPANRPLLLSVGRLEPVKNPAALVEFLARLRVRLDFHAVVVGDGSLRPSLERLARRLGLDNLTFLGYQPDAEALLPQADLLVSTSHHEGCSLVLLEAMRAGCPVLVTDVGGNRELVKRGGHGLCVEPGRPQEFVEAAAELLASPERRRRMGQLGRSAAAEFSAETWIRAMQALYSEVLARPPMLTVGGYYGAGNAGDEAILAGLLGQCREAGLNRVRVLSFDPAQTTRLHGVDSLSIGRRGQGWVDLLAALVTSDLFILGGGGLLQDGSARVVPFWLSRALLARAMGTPVVYLAHGVGPLHSRTARWLVKRMPEPTAITVRDLASRDCLARCGRESGTIQITADLALALPAPQERRPRAGVLGVCPTPREPLDHLAAALSALKPVSLVIMPLHRREDREPCRELASRLRARGCVVEEPPPPDHPSEWLRLLGTLEGIVSARLHGLVLGACVGLPGFGLGDRSKLRSFQARLGLEADMQAPAPDLADQLQAWYAGLTFRRERLERALPSLRRAAHENLTCILRCLPWKRPCA